MKPTGKMRRRLRIIDAKTGKVNYDSGFEKRKK